MNPHPRPSRPLISLAGVLVTFVGTARGDVHPVVLASELEGPQASTLTFEGHGDLTAVNSAYAGQGIVFSRDDGDRVFAYNWTALGRQTVSPDMVLATIVIPGVNGAVTHLNLESSTPLTSIGAYFGNDQNDPDFTQIRLSAWDASNTLLGSVTVTANQNTSVDQFIGLRSDAPFTRVRFENLDATGSPSRYNSVVIDNLTFVSVPEPSVRALFALALLGLGFMGWQRGRTSQ